jgi:CBS domain containing-hemolysin-like protein
MELFLEPQIIAGLLTLIVLEIVLGIDNLVFIAILADRLPPDQRDRARVIGLSLALVMRLVLLAGISWLVTLTAPLVALGPFSLSGRDLILLLGGLFLLFKATVEIHERLEGGSHVRKTRGYASFAAVLTQIVVLDAVFSLDSVITAVGMVDELWVMMTAVVVAMIVMIIASKPLTNFVNAHPTVVMLCLGFLLMIGLSLISEAFHYDVPKGYLYAAITFSILVETFNQLRLVNEKRRLAAVPLRQRTADAVLRLLGGSPELGDVAHPSKDSGRSEEPQPTFAKTERELIAGVLRLGNRTTRSIMTPRQEIGWLDVNASNDEIRRTLHDHGHARYLVCNGGLEELEGVVIARDLMPDLLDGKSVDLRTLMQPALVVHDRLPVVRLIERLKTTPTRLAVVADDHGNIDGVVTPTDVLAAIAGDLVEEEDAEPEPVRRPDGSIEFDGMTPLDEAAVILDRPSLMEADDYTTIAGFVLWRLGRIPEENETFEWEGWRFTVVGLQGHRIETVVATPSSESASAQMP